ncbi:hypothetical protein [Streptomyces sp. NPDC056061]|uniref:hypothetical protein n=1 Tax=Streptomyces sp. NPDC056061 TaxID=3345700 RepID=UPI0035DA9BED
MGRQRNTRLEVAMAEYGFTHQSLADEINQATARIFGENHPRKCTDRHVRRWISGEVRWPWTRYLHGLEQLFDRPAQALGFIPRGRNSANLPAPPQSPAPTKEVPVRRRRFITASAATTQALTLLEPRLRRSRAYYTVQLAELQLAQGNTTTAATTAALIDTTHISSQNITDRLTALRHTLTNA